MRVDRGFDEAGRAGLGRRVIGELMKIPFERAARFVVVLGRDVDVFDTGRAMFHWAANFDAGRDAVWSGDRVAFDATAKTAGDAYDGEPVRRWPPEPRFDEATLALIERRWGEYGIEGGG
ncbi:MAG: hypothetical protein R3B57_14935 [Phycisphaerales bacterium]